MAPVRISKTKTTTWLGREATYVVYSYDNARDGKCIVVRNWTDGGHSIVCVQGDGRTLDFRQFEEVDYAATAPAVQIRAVVDAMAARHFASQPKVVDMMTWLKALPAQA